MSIVFVLVKPAPSGAKSGMTGAMSRDSFSCGSGIDSIVWITVGLVNMLGVYMLGELATGPPVGAPATWNIARR
jgi:hypothetical protein